MKRYDRHFNLLSSDQWQRLASQQIVVAGAGGLGSHVLDLLVRLAPIAVEIWDPAILDPPDLNRQSLYTADDLGAAKVDAAAARLSAINPDATITVRREAVTADSIFGASVCAYFDCLDTFAARADLERALIAANVTAVDATELDAMPGSGPAGAPAPGGIVQPAAPLLVHGGVGTFFGQVALLRPPAIGYRDLFGPGFAELATEDKRVMPSTVAVVAAMQVAEWVAWLRGDRPWLDGGETGPETRLVTYDGTTNESSSLVVRAAGAVDGTGE